MELRISTKSGRISEARQAIAIEQSSRALTLARKALSGDVEAMIRWLMTYGGPQWQPGGAAAVSPDRSEQTVSR
jgi:hypothetical protein